MLSVLTTQEEFDRALSDLESRVGQTSPVHSLAFLRVLAGILAMMRKSTDQHIIERTKQNLVSTATGIDLDRIGAEPQIDTPRKVAVAAQMTATISTTVNVPALRVFISDSTKKLYYNMAEAVTGGGVATMTLKSVLAGADYTLAIDDTLTIQVPLSGCNSTATVTAVTVDGLDVETDTAYRRRIMTEMRTQGGGGNNADYRTWAEAVDGVERAYPYSGCSTTHNRFRDGDMEDTGTTEWTSVNSAVLSKATGTPHGGSRCLRVTHGGVASPGASQTFAPYTTYRITGWARGDGTSSPVALGGGASVWTGTTSASWQAFDVTFTVTASGVIHLGGSSGTTGNYTEWDDVTLVQTSGLGDATIFIECSSDLEADGIPDQDLLDDVYDAILTDPITGIARPTLGTLDTMIHVEPISRTSVNLEIRGLSVDASVLDQVKDEIEEQVDIYLREITPYIDRLDSPYSNNSLLTDLTLSTYIQNVLTPYGGTAEGIGMSVSTGVFISSYQVGMGEMLKLGTITYV